MSGGCVPVPILSACMRERSMPSVLERSKSPRAVEATCSPIFHLDKELGR